MAAGGTSRCTIYIYKTNNAMNCMYTLGLDSHNFKHLNEMHRVLFSFYSFHPKRICEIAVCFFWLSAPAIHAIFPSLPTYQVIAHYPLWRVSKRQHLLRLLWRYTCADQLLVWVGYLCGLSNFVGKLSLWPGQLRCLVSHAGQLLCGVASSVDWCASMAHRTDRCDVCRVIFCSGSL